VQTAEATANPVDERRTKKTKTIKALGRRRGSREPASQAAQCTASLLHSRKPQRTQSKATASPPRQPTTTGYHYWLNGERERERENERKRGREREKERERARNSSNDCRASRERERESEREKERERKTERERKRGRERGTAVTIEEQQ
jgi:hypothetical protein